MKIILCFIISALSACGLDGPASQATQTVCTEEDQTGTCGDPGGGSPNALADAVEDYADSVVLQYANYAVESRTTSGCYVSMYGRPTCWVSITFHPGFTVDVHCTTEASGDIFCSSQCMGVLCPR